jgi:hypothetical protein
MTTPKRSTNRGLDISSNLNHFRICGILFIFYLFSLALPISILPIRQNRKAIFNPRSGPNRAYKHTMSGVISRELMCASQDCTNHLGQISNTGNVSEI